MSAAYTSASTNTLIQWVRLSKRLRPVVIKCLVPFGVKWRLLKCVTTHIQWRQQNKAKYTKAKHNSTRQNEFTAEASFEECCRFKESCRQKKMKFPKGQKEWTATAYVGPWLYWLCTKYKFKCILFAISLPPQSHLTPYFKIRFGMVLREQKTLILFTISLLPQSHLIPISKYTLEWY